ncbi:uncharacterized protein MEPE_04028 [Melanopsichium pennsylvanicum]|uniref:Zn(2)-C6 fungal-type domain-containing protein n=2 Tax=Melanopsichium pennsylvanicum TaxID=63383 RepID=A0AAJ5C6A5_9BASI|nr:fungal zn-cys binuclear cluster domain-containing protein [Melanopsichium pennsylvanicum 4]SNX85319.1 uncharacterized protein MEPE_04028 [Melanopsichium pennsylvanicum]
MAEPSRSTWEELKPVLIPFKRSQRPSWSCTECARRKIRCDKKVPCASCVKRGRADHCRLEGSSYEVAGSSPPRLPASPVHTSDDGRIGDAGSSTPSESRRRLSSAVSAQGDSKPVVPDGADIFLQGLSRLQVQLDRIEQRLNRQAKQEESIEDVKARLNDIEDVISALGENRASWAQPANTTNGKGAARASQSATIHQGEMEVDRRLDDVGGGRSHIAAGIGHRAETTPPAMQQQERNAELASTDAATTLEFLTLGKDRRRDVAFDASSYDSDGEVGHDNRPGMSAAPGQIASPASLHVRHAETISSEAGPDGRSRMLKHLRRGLPARVVSRIDALLRSNPDDLPPANLLARPTVKPITDGIKASTLSPSAIRRIVGVAKEIGAWQHCCIHFPTFEREVEAFLAITKPDKGDPEDASLESYRAIDPAWLSLYYVICSIAIHQMSEEEGAFCGLGAETERMRLASVLLHAAMDSLSLADYLVKPSVYCCQTIAILCVAGHNICGSDLLTSLLAIGIKIGHTLGLHALGRTARFLEACAVQRGQVLYRVGIRNDESGSLILPDESPRQFAIWKKRIIDLEVGKRVWWAFTQQDYFAIPFSGCFSIVEGQYDTPLPHNCSDEDLEEGRLINREVNVLTVASKQRFTCHVAKIVCDFFEDLNKTRDVPSLSLVKHHEDRLHFVTDRFKACLDPGRLASSQGSSKTSLPSFTTVLQHYLFISVQHKILVMHRAFLSRDVSAEERALSHAASIETARGVLHELERGLGLNTDGDDRPQLDLQSRVHGGALWTIPYHSVAAVTILALDMFQPTSSGSQRALRRQEVKRALEALGRITKKSAIARRGCQLLTDLLEEGERYERRPGRPKKRKVTNGVDSVLKRLRLPEDENAEVTSQAGYPSTAITTEPFIGIDHAADPHTDRTLEASWFSHFNHGSTRSDASSVLAEGTSPDEDHHPAASFGYGSTNFNPLAGNSTSRASNSATFHPGEASNSLSSIFMSYDSDRSSTSDTYGAIPASMLRCGMNSDFVDAGRSSLARNGLGWKDRTNMPQESDHATAVPNWSTATASMSLDGTPANSIPGMNLNMPQQQLAQILPALESMPDVWKLFDGTLGQSLVAFEESGF